MDEILTTARDLKLEVNEDNIEELIMEHEEELTIEELQEILNEEHQEIQGNVIPNPLFGWLCASEVALPPRKPKDADSILAGIHWHNVHPCIMGDPKPDCCQESDCYPL
ncbi:hypothetical protein TNCV_889731 [Trichonephila clavipes]|nr:hypothetical protein TNCV_889731 [Trichonephila clavipes]